jgi:drug/metabolite transporter (DMT)-like permease
MLVMIYNGESFNIKTKEDFKTLMIRSAISGFNGMAASFFQMYLPLTVYYTINSSSTIFTFVLNYFLYGIPITSHQKKAVVISMVGIVLVINGRSIYQLLDSSY